VRKGRGFRPVALARSTIGSLAGSVLIPLAGQIRPAVRHAERACGPSLANGVELG